MTLDLLGQPINWARMTPREASVQLYALADREPRGSAERGRLYGIAGHFAAKAREAERRAKDADERKRARDAEDIARIKRATRLVAA